VVKTRTKRLKNIFINTLCSRWQLFQILSDPAPVRTLRFEPGDPVHPFLLQTLSLKQLHFFSINKTTIPTVIKFPLKRKGCQVVVSV